jgi:uncharacterized membrane protein (DUF485 family)
MDAAIAGPVSQLQYAAEGGLTVASAARVDMIMSEQGLSKKVRRMAIGLALLAVSFYVAFIVMTALAS